jgi:3-methyladenine DNA glycosylase AlkC
MEKGTPLKVILGREAVACLAQNILYVHGKFDAEGFCESTLQDLDSLELMQRGQHIAAQLRRFLPDSYAKAMEVLLESLTPPNTETEDLGLAVFFYLPLSCFIAEYGENPDFNKGHDPFDLSMRAMKELTTRFTAEFAIRPFLIRQQERTLLQVTSWLDDPNPHVRRLCSEGTRPRLPWGKRIPALITDPRPTLPILEALKNDECLYVRRSVANHLGDIAKSHPEITFSTCTRWLREGASPELQWAIRHAVRHPAKKGDARALEIRAKARGN